MTPWRTLSLNIRLVFHCEGTHMGSWGIYHYARRCKQICCAESLQVLFPGGDEKQRAFLLCRSPSIKLNTWNERMNKLIHMGAIKNTQICLFLSRRSKTISRLNKLIHTDVLGRRLKPLKFAFTKLN
jgi:hypothetical protein